MAADWTETTPITPNNLNTKPIEKAYPVGSIYMNASDDTNPATLLGVGTWERFGQGRVLVSQDSTDADFDGIGETGGEKEHQLTENEMPSHNHQLFGQSSSDTTSAGIGRDARGIMGDRAGFSDDYGYFNSGDNSYVNTKGSDSPHNNLQPYITVYMWVRTA